MSDSRFRKVFISLLDVLLNIRPDNVKTNPLVLSNA